jgi:hypothetical protein
MSEKRAAAEPRRNRTRKARKAASSLVGRRSLPARPAPRASFLRDAAWDSNHLDAGHGRLFYTRMHSLSAARRAPRKLVRGQDAQVVQVGKARRGQDAQVARRPGGKART